MMLSKCCTQNVRKSGRPSCGHRAGKGQSSSQFPRRAVLKNMLTNHQTIVLISHTSKVMPKIWQARLQHYVNHELPDVQDGFRKGRTTDQIANICWIIEKTREFQKNMSLCFIDYAVAFDCVVHNNCGNLLER